MRTFPHPTGRHGSQATASPTVPPREHVGRGTAHLRGHHPRGVSRRSHLDLQRARRPRGESLTLAVLGAPGLVTVPVRAVASAPVAHGGFVTQRIALVAQESNEQLLDRHPASRRPPSCGARRTSRCSNSVAVAVWWNRGLPSPAARLRCSASKHPPRGYRSTASGSSGAVCAKGRPPTASEPNSCRRCGRRRHPARTRCAIVTGLELPYQ